MRVAWIDASAGIAGDMLLGALVDAGADLAAVHDAVHAVVPGAVSLRRSQVTRAGLRATKVDVDVLVSDPAHRTWSDVRAMLAEAELPQPVHARAAAVFARLAEAEGRVHGIPAEQVHFHEVGALDAIADVVGVCAALADLGVGEVTASPVALGSGTVAAHHGRLPVPVPAVLELARGWEVLAGGSGELATPTGLALLRTLAGGCGPLPAVQVDGVGVGAGSRDTPGRANVVRVVLGAAPGGAAHPRTAVPPQSAVLLETNVDDLDPRLWPEVLSAVLAAGALDAWLTPILMKKGRPATTLHVLAAAEDAATLSSTVLEHTSTLGVRRSTVHRDVLERAWLPVDVAGGAVRVKVGHRHGRVVQAMPEFDDVAALAGALGRPVTEVLDLARAAAVQADLVSGRPWPPGAAPR